jgi:hypothetical protein
MTERIAIENRIEREDRGSVRVGEAERAHFDREASVVFAVRPASPRVVELQAILRWFQEGRGNRKRGFRPLGRNPKRSERLAVEKHPKALLADDTVRTEPQMKCPGRVPRELGNDERCFVSPLAGSHPDRGRIGYGKHEVEDTMVFGDLPGGDAGPDYGRKIAASRARTQNALSRDGLQRTVHSASNQAFQVGQLASRAELLDDTRGRSVEADEDDEGRRFSPACAKGECQ